MKPKSYFWGAMFLVFSISLPSQAWATSSMECAGINTDAGARILFGAGPILNVIAADVFLNDRMVSTEESPGAERANVVQFSGSSKQISLDLIDDQASEHLVEIRIVRSLSDDREPFQIGYMRVGQAPPVGIMCDGP